MLCYIRNNEKINCFFVLTFVMLILLFFETVYADSGHGKEVSASVFFLDGTEETIIKPAFIYEFVYQVGKKYFNPPHHQKKVSGIAYNESDNRDAAKDNLVETNRIERIELIWDTDKNYFFRPQKIMIFLNDGSQLGISGKSIESMSSKFLCGNRVAPTIHGKVMIRGKKALSSNEEQLSGLLAYSANHNKSITVRKIIFNR